MTSASRTTPGESNAVTRDAISACLILSLDIEVIWDRDRNSLASHDAAIQTPAPEATANDRVERAGGSRRPKNVSPTQVLSSTRRGQS